MKLAVVAANGRTANKVIDEAVGRGFDVTAFGSGSALSESNSLTFQCPAVMMMAGYLLKEGVYDDTDRKTIVLN